MRSVTAVIIEKLRVLPSEKQQIVLELVELLETEAWQEVYQGRFAELRRELQIGMEASARGEVVDSDVMFKQLRDKLQQRKAIVEE